MDHSKNIRFILLLLTATFFMGSSFPTGKFLIAHEIIPPFYLGGTRFIGAGILLLLYCAIRYGRAHIIPTAKDSLIRGFCSVLIIGLLQTASAIGFLNLALERIDSALASVLFFTNPLWVLILGHFLHIDRLSLQPFFGVLLGIAGVFLCLNVEKEGSMIGMLFALCGAISWAICTLGSKNLLKIDNPAVVLTGWQMLLGGIILYLISLISHETYSPLQLSNLGWLNFLWLMLPASIGSFSLWFLALQKGGAAQASSFLFLAPMFASLLSILFLSEQLSLKFLLGCLLIFSAIYLINRPQKKP